MTRNAKNRNTPPRGLRTLVPAKKWLGMGTAASVLLLGGCANLTPDQGMGPVESMALNVLNKDVGKIRSEDEALQAQGRVTVLLRKPLSVDSAVQIALLNNRGLQAAYNDLGITEAQLAADVLPPNPKLSFSLLAASTALEIERQVAINVIAILTLPRRQEIAEIKFRAGQFKAMTETLRVAAETRRAYYRAIAASQTVGFLTQARVSAEAVSELATKLGETGALTKLDQAREHSFYAEVSGQLAVARLRERVEREKLTRAMGLWGPDTGFRLPSQLKPLPARAKTMETVEQEAIANRVDLQMGRLELDALAKSLGLTQATRLVNAFDFGVKDNREKSPAVDNGIPTTDRLRRRGYDIQLEIPIYDFNEAKVQEAAERYSAGVNRLVEKAVIIRSEARVAYTGYRGAYDIARHYRDNVAPLRKIITDEGLLRYNGMLADLFQLLTDQRGNVTSNVAGIDALRDYWLATVDLQAALVGGGVSSSGSETPATVMASGGSGPAE